MKMFWNWVDMTAAQDGCMCEISLTVKFYVMCIHQNKEFSKKIISGIFQPMELGRGFCGRKETGDKSRSSFQSWLSHFQSV
jgi:hypothetical protein